MSSEVQSPIFYNGNHEHVAALGGPGDAESFRTEARFIAYHANKLAKEFGDHDIVCTSLNDGSSTRTFGFPGGYYRSGGRICGFEADPKSGLDACLEELDWRNL